MSRLEPTNEASAMQKEISAIAEQGGGTTKVEQLIQQYCPDGVEYVKIGQIAQVGTGSSNGNEADDEGMYPFFVRSQTVKRKNDYEYDEEAVIIPGEGGIGDIFHYINGKYALHQRVYRIHFTIPSINTKFAFYYLKSAFKQFILMKAVSATVASIRKPMIEGFPIPIPPLHVQEEIVRILDTLTELQAELQAELQKRLQQYNYYRDNLLSFEGRTDVEWKKLGDVCLMERGTSATKGTMQSGEIPVISGGRQPAFYCNQSNRTGETITVAGSGAGAGYVQYWNEPIFVCDAFSIKGNDGLMTKYIYYYLTSNQERIYATKKGGGVPHVHISSIDKFEIPVPPLPVQEEIVRILDRFDTLTTDITAGLPAEIEARRKQYEYYRDQLLTFKQKA